MIIVSVRSVTLAIACTMFMAHAQQPSQILHVSDNTAGGITSWFSPGGLVGQVQVHQLTDPITNSPAVLVDLFLYQSYPYYSVFVDGFAPGTAVSSKAFDSVTLAIADLSTMDGGRFQYVSVIDCRSGPCVFSNDPSAIPHLSLSGTWTKYGPRTLQQSGTETQTFQDYLGNTYSTTTSGIQTSSDATFQGYLGGGPPAPPNITSFGSIFISKGVTISFTRPPKP
jgi:hypothetical protein